MNEDDANNGTPDLLTTEDAADVSSDATSLLSISSVGIEYCHPMGHPRETFFPFCAERVLFVGVERVAVEG